MDRHAGFAAAVELDQAMLEQILRVLYNAGQLGPSVSLTVPGFDGDIFLQPPTLVFLRANADRIALTLRGWGNVTVTPPGRPPEPRQVLFHAELRAGATASIAAPNLMFGVDAATASLDTLEITATSGAFTPDAQAFLVSSGFHDAVQTQLRTLLALLSLLFPPIDLKFLGAIASASSTTVRVRVLDGALALGIDLTAAPVVTTGDPGMLVEFLEGMQIAMWTNPVAIPVAYAEVQKKVQKTVSDSGASLDRFSMTVQEGGLSIAGHASKDGNGVEFSLMAVPKLIRPGTHEEWDEEYGEHFEIDTPAREELWFDMQDVHVDIERAWWVVLLDVIGALFAGIGTLIVEAIVSMIRSNIVGGIDSSDRTVAQRNQTFTLRGVTRPPMQLRIERFECHAEGVFTGILFRPVFWAGALQGYTSYAAEEVLRSPPSFRILLPPDVLADDPALRIAWTVRNAADNAIVLARDEAAAGLLSIALDPTAVLAGTRFGIDCRVYRVLGAAITEVFSARTELRISDALDRSHPYVRWSHDPITPTVRVEADGSHTLLGYEPRVRHSDIHRTDLPGRCRMASRYSAAAPLEYLDALPFPRAQLDARRAVVCDYCFYGGPTKTVPLIP